VSDKRGRGVFLELFEESCHWKLNRTMVLRVSRDLLKWWPLNGTAPGCPTVA
jgi:hypothetical protein